MKELSKTEKLNLIFTLIEKYGVSNYEISKQTGISEPGVGKIINRISLNPHNATVDLILDYLTETYGGDFLKLGSRSINVNYNSEGEIIAVNEPEEPYEKKSDLEEIISALKILTESNQILVKSNSDLVQMLNSKL